MMIRNAIRRALGCACIVCFATGALAATPDTAAEAGPKATPKMIACMTACEQTQMTCLQGALETPVEQRTIKQINTARACNRTEERCDHRCRNTR
jgi:hypothetical protein